jgi:hypothetical protein
MADKNFFDQFDPPAQSGVIITKRVTPKDTAETISAQAKAAHAEATDSSEARIKNAQAVALERKNSDQAAEDALARMAPNSTKHGEAYFDAIHLPENDRVLARAYAKGDLG